MVPDNSPAPPLTYAATPGSRLRERAGRVLRMRSVGALTDQAVSSGSNFLTMILVTRTLTPVGLGQFSLLWELLMFLNGLHAALIVYPLTVRGATFDPDDLRKVNSIALIFTLLLAVPFGGAMFAMGMWQQILIGVMGAAALVVFLVHETSRRALMAQFRYGDLIRADSVAYLGMAGGVLLLVRSGHLSVLNLFTTMTISFLGGIVVNLANLPPVRVSRAQILSRMVEFWELGRWILASNLTTMFTVTGVHFTLAYFKGLSDVGHFQAMTNLVRITNPVLAAMTSLIVPAVAQSGHARAARRYALLGGALLLPYFGFMAVAPEWGVSLLYGDRSEYAGYPVEVRLTVAAAAIGYATAMLVAILGGLGRSKGFFAVQLVYCIASAVLVLPAAAWLGWKAAVAAGFVALAATASTAILLLWRDSSPQKLPAAE